MLPVESMQVQIRHVLKSCGSHTLVGGVFSPSAPLPSFKVFLPAYVFFLLFVAPTAARSFCSQYLCRKMWGSGNRVRLLYFFPNPTSTQVLWLPLLHNSFAVSPTAGKRGGLAIERADGAGAKERR